jgi:hypothetical protein
MSPSIPPRVTTSIRAQLRAVESILLGLRVAHELHKADGAELSEVRRHMMMALYELAPGVHERYLAGDDTRTLIAMLHPERSTTPPPTRTR